MEGSGLRVRDLEFRVQAVMIRGECKGVEGVGITTSVKLQGRRSGVRGGRGVRCQPAGFKCEVIL